MSAPPDREDLLSRLQAIGEDSSGAGATDQRTAREVIRLLRSESREHGGVISPSVAYAIGLYYGRRGLAFGRVAGRPARKMAARILTSFFLDGSEPIPTDMVPVVLPAARRHAARVLSAALRDEGAEPLGKAASYWRRIAVATPDGDSAAAEVAEGLSVSLVKLFDYTGDPAELNDVIAFCRTVLAHPPAGASLGQVRRFLALTLQSRVGRFGSADPQGDFGEAIALLANCDLAAGKPRDRAVLLSLLSGVFGARAELAESLADADQAVALARQAAELAGPRHPLQLVLRMTLFAALLVRLNLRADPKDLTEVLGLVAVNDGQVSELPAPAATGQRLAAAVALAMSASTHAGSADLDRAVNLLRTAVSELPDTSPGKPTLLSFLATMLQQRYDTHDSAADQDSAIEVARHAVALEDDPQRRARALMALSERLRDRFEATADRADLDAALAVGQDALALVPLRALPAASVRGWAVLLLAKFEVCDTAADLREATRILRHLVTSPATPVPVRANAEVNLAQVLLRHSADHSPADLDEAVDQLRQALTERGLGGSQRGRVEFLLATALAKRSRQQAVRQDANESIALLNGNLKNPDLPVNIRIEAAVLAADLEQEVEEPGWEGRAADLLATVVELLPFTAARTLGRADRQRALGMWHGLAARAAALALDDPRPGEPPERRAARALGLLEAGRTILLNQAYDTRGDLSGARGADPELARRFLELRAKLERDPSDGAAGRGLPAAGTATAAQLLAFEAGAGDQRRAGVAFAEVIEGIRKLPGQSGFMRAPDLPELTAQAAHGPVVVLNVTEMRSDAFLVTPAGVRVVPLPALTPDGAADAAELLHQSVQASHAGGMLQVLDWLWTAIARPVLDELGLERRSAGLEPWPRIWWVAGGVLANMPLHAAGRYQSGSTPAHEDGEQPAESVLDRVISSYAPSVRTLHYLRERSARPAVRAGSSRGSLVVAMGQTPDTKLRDLPEAGPEAAFVAGILPEPVLLVRERPAPARLAAEATTPPAAGPGDQPTTERVLAELARSRIAHFACHAESDAMDPSRSGLRLLDAPLTVTALSAQDLDSVTFAFLSACGTALNHAQDLLDESIHVVSAFQLAGIPQVVGTFWEVEDFASLAVVQSFYTRLQTSGLDTAAAAGILHEITRLLRDEVPDAPWIWASHMYAGC